ncbi:MAG: hypothetical protein ACFFD4_29330 [Candidatus Odinarchaeota archaeon]
MTIRFGFVEKIILALAELGLVSYGPPSIMTNDPVVEAENKIIKLFLEGKAGSKTTRISRARHNLFRREDAITRKSLAVDGFQQKPEEKKNALLREAYLHVYSCLSQAIEKEALSMLAVTARIPPSGKRIEFTSMSDRLSPMKQEMLFVNLHFVSQLLADLRDKLGLTGYKWGLSTFTTAVNDLEPAMDRKGQRLEEQRSKKYWEDKRKDRARRSARKLVNEEQ